MNARFNARDATWFWLQAVQEYSNMAAEGADLLNACVMRMYPTDESEALIENAKVSVDLFLFKKRWCVCFLAKLPNPNVFLILH